MTAVQWLENELLQFNFPDAQKLVLAILLHKAKEMEKDQIEDAFQLGKWNGYDNAKGLTELIDPTQHYNETYKSTKK